MARPAPSAAVLGAIGRRGSVAGARNVRIEWYIKNVTDKIEMTMKDRLKIAADLVHSATVRNISTPVVVGQTKTGKQVVVGRSKPGEFPRAETGNLMRTLFHGVHKAADGEWEGYVGTPLQYGAILEVSQRLNRTYMKRTLDEKKDLVKKVLSGPIKT